MQESKEIGKQFSCFKSFFFQLELNQKDLYFPMPTVMLTRLDLAFISVFAALKCLQSTPFPKTMYEQLFYPESFNHWAASCLPLLWDSDLTCNMFGERDWSEQLASMKCDLACNTMSLMFPGETNQLSAPHGHSIK